MAVFPESMAKLNIDDAAGSLRTIENYIRYITERMEFANSNTGKLVSAAGVSNVEIYKMILTMGDSIALTQAMLTNTNNTLNTMKQTVADLQEQTETMNGTIKNVQSQISNLTTRVEALEGGE